MKKQNYMKVTIYKAKMCTEGSFYNYNLKLDFCKQISETEKISGKDFEMGGKSYFFDIPSGAKPTNLELSAVSKTLLIFDSQLAKVSVPVNVNKMDDKREWYYLKNSKDENVVGILMSIYCEIKYDKSLVMENANNSYVIPNYNQPIKNKNDMSYDLYRNNSNNFIANVMNRTHANYGGNLMSNHSIDEKDNFRSNGKLRISSEEKGNLDNTLLFHENYKSPDISYMNNNLLSPCSYRVDNDKSNMNYTMLNMSNLHSKLNNSNMKQNMTVDNMNVFLNNNDFNYLNTADSFFENKFPDEKISGDQAEIIKAIKQRAMYLREDQEKLKKINEEIMKNKEKLRQKESILIKEKEKLESYIRNFKSHKSEYDNKSKSLNQNYIKFNNDLNKFNVVRELFNFEKRMFLDVNLVLNLGKISHNCNSTEEKINELNHKLSYSKMTQPNGVTDTSGSSLPLERHSNPNSRKKNIYYEKPENLIYLNKSNKGSFDLQNNNYIYVNDNNTNLNNDPSGIIQKSLNNSIQNQNTKFYTPIAQINLNNKRNSVVTPQSAVSNFEVSSPKVEKIVNSENKLIDSLDNLNLQNGLSKQNVNSNDNKNKSKPLNADLLKKSEKSDEKKKPPIKNNANTITPTYSNINYTPNTNLKDKDKKILFTNAKNPSDKNLIKKDISNSSSSSAKVELHHPQTNSKIIQNTNSQTPSTFSSYKLNLIKKSKI